MEKLMKIAKKHADEVEIYSIKNSNKSLNYGNNIPKDMDFKIQSGVSLRIIKDGKIGMAYTKNLKNRKGLVENAIKSLKGGVKAKFSFPSNYKIDKLDSYDEEIENITGAKLLKEAERFSDRVKIQDDTEHSVSLTASTKEIIIINSNGLDVKTKSSSFSGYGGITFKGTGSGINRAFASKKFELIPDEIIEEIISFYKKSEKTVNPEGGRMKVLFMPFSSITYLWRIFSGTNAKNIYENISPLKGKIGKKIFSENFTLYNDPLNDSYPGARPFDDEGIKSRKLKIIENGVLKNYFTNLDYAEKVGIEPTSTGYRSGMWGGDPVTMKPNPSLKHLLFGKGAKTVEEIIGSMDRGVIVEGALGAHSGNIPNGDYSIGLSPGLYVEDGKIVGNVKDTMVAGNIYDTFKNVLEVSKNDYYFMNGIIPAILCDNVSVSM